MKERGMIFNSEMVRAILDDRKTQTRRPVKCDGFIQTEACPYGKKGDRIYVRETSRKIFCGYIYRANKDEDMCWPKGWTPSIHMPKEAARIWLEITNIRVERVQEITETDCRMEGIGRVKYECASEIDGGCGACENCDPLFWFEILWDSIYKNWSENPWVWVIEFKRVEK